MFLLDDFFAITKSKTISNWRYICFKQCGGWGHDDLICYSKYIIDWSWDGNFKEF